MILPESQLIGRLLEMATWIFEPGGVVVGNEIEPVLDVESDPA